MYLLAYLTLYRRRRPLTFDDMTGQEHITRTLSNALSRGRLAHAYLFCGPRGTGKTTAAKILARTMNCEQYPAPEPCGRCRPCNNIAAGVSMDVVEMDAASNRGIDEIRELRERTRFAGSESRYKVYIIDEAHMLTPEACNAFLKTLEEPPQNVVFILATTEPSKLPSTIVSRCQRFDFQLLSVEQIRQRLEQVLDAEGWQADDEAIGQVARLADGSLRDALGILEQCYAYGEARITAEHVRSVTGATRLETIDALVKAAVENDLDSGFLVLEQIIYGGRDLNLLLRDFTFIFSRLLLDSENQAGPASGSLHGFEDLIDSYRGRIERQPLLDAVELLHEVGGELKHAHFPQFILEVAFIRLLRLLHGRIRPAPFLSADQPAQIDGDEPAEAKEAHRPAPQAAGTVKVPEEGAEEEAKAEKPGEIAETGADPGAENDRLAMLKQAWPHLLQELKKKQKSTAAWLEPAILADCRGDLVCLEYTREYAIHQIRVLEDSHRGLVEEQLSAFCGVPIKIKAETVESEERDDEKYKPEEADTGSVEPAGETEKKDPPGVEDALKLFDGKLIDTD